MPVIYLDIFDNFSSFIVIPFNIILSTLNPKPISTIIELFVSCSLSHHATLTSPSSFITFMLLTISVNEDKFPIW